MPSGIPNTCPDIDRILDAIKELDSNLKDITSYLKDIEGEEDLSKIQSSIDDAKYY